VEDFFWEIAKKSLKDLLDQRSDRFRGILLSVSGHIDSMFLAHLAVQDAELRPKIRGIVHFNFHLRSRDSDEDQELVEAFAAKNALSFTSVNADLSGREVSLQERARDVRQQWYTSALADGYVVATGHHSDDISETVLFRMARGTSCGTALGMNSVRADGIWRPLIGISKQDILLQCKHREIHYRTDSSNSQNEYARNRIRNVIIPELESLFAGAGDRIRAFATEAAELHQFAKDYVSSKFPRSNEATVAVSELIAYEPLLSLAITEVCARANVAVNWNKEELRKLGKLIGRHVAQRSAITLLSVGDRDLRLENGLLSITPAEACYFENKRRYQQCGDQLTYMNVPLFLPPESALNYLPTID